MKALLRLSLSECGAGIKSESKTLERGKEWASLGFLIYSFLIRLVAPSMNFLLLLLSRPDLIKFGYSLCSWWATQSCVLSEEVFTVWLVSVFVCHHFLLQRYQHVFESLPIPVLQIIVLTEINSASGWVHAWQSDLVVELDCGWLLRVLGPAYNWEEVDFFLEFGVVWALNGCIPVGKGLVIGVVKSIRDRTVSETFLSLLKFVVKLENSWL